jgi:hypothetical protein
MWTRDGRAGEGTRAGASHRELGQTLARTAAGAQLAFDGASRPLLAWKGHRRLASGGHRAAFAPQHDEVIDNLGAFDLEEAPSTRAGAHVLACGPHRPLAGRVALRSMSRIAGLFPVVTAGAVPFYFRLRQNGNSPTTSIELLISTLVVVGAICLLAGLRGRVDPRAGRLDFTRPPGKRKIPRRIR